MISKRCLACFIDYYLIVFFVILISFLLNINNVFVTIVVSFLIIIKDLMFKNASLGKRIMRIEIKKVTNATPKFYELVFRNIFLFIWPIEVLLILFQNKRIGDIVFKTKVVEKK